MADKKISALTAASTPLAGTEVLPIVQSGATVKVAVSDLTAGRAISATSVTASTGNFVVGTSGQGIDFSATPGTGTSELLADYEEGTWTPTDASGAGLTFTSVSGRYTKIGRMVVAQCNFTFPVTASANTIAIDGLPFTLSSSQANRQGFISYKNAALTVGDTLLPSASSTIFEVRTSGGGNRTNAEYSGAILISTCIYEV